MTETIGAVGTIARYLTGLNNTSERKQEIYNVSEIFELYLTN